MFRRRRLYLAARDHLEQADAVLTRAGEDAVEIRGMIRYVASVLDEKATSPLPDKADVVAFPFPSRRDGHLDY